VKVDGEMSGMRRSLQAGKGAEKAGPVLQCPIAIQLLREADGRWITDITELPGVTVYGEAPEEATLKAKALEPRSGTLRFSVAA